MTWRYIAQRISGPAKGQFLDWNLPLRDVRVTDSIGPWWLSAVISPEVLLPTAEDGKPVIDKWSTAIWAEEDGRIRGGGIVVVNNVEGPSRTIECMGYLGYPQGVPFTGSFVGIQVDPIDVYRMLWDHVQSFSNGNLDVTVDNTTSPVRIGKPDDPNASGTDREGPYRLDWWEAPDCGDTMDWLQGITPFEARERHTWNSDKTSILHRVELAYPRFGRRRDDLRFAVGENINTPPTLIANGEDYANTGIGLGSGEGRKMVRSPEVIVNDGRLRRVALVTDKTQKSPSMLADAVRGEIGRRRVDYLIDNVVVTNHPNAPIGSWSVGDEVFITGRVRSQTINQWYRVVDTTIYPENADQAYLSLERVTS